jgi:hypothetical protein
MYVSAEVRDTSGTNHGQQHNLIEDLSNTGFGDWFKLTISLSVLSNSSSLMLTGAIEDWGTNGTAFVSSWGGFSLPINSPDLANAPFLYVEFLGTSCNGQTLIDNFSTLSFETTESSHYPALSIRVSEVEISWTTLLDKTYQLQFTSDLTSGSWTNLGDPIHTSGSATSFRDSVAAGTGGRYYRVVELQ